MLTAKPSTYDMFALIELFGRKEQSVIIAHHKKNKSNIRYCFNICAPVWLSDCNLITNGE